MNANSALTIDLLTVSYDRTPALWDLSFSVPSGKLIGIIGPNGAGKSTLIKVVLGLIKPISGTIAFFGKPLSQVQKNIAYIPQKETVDWNFPITVEELVLMGRYGKLGILKRPQAADYQAVEHYLEVVGLTPFKKRQIQELSGGQQQRAFLARALIQEAEIYFLDEPFTGIDAATELLLIQLLKNLVAKGKTVFVVHHDLNSVESIFNWVILLNMRLIGNGEVSQTMTPEKLRQAYGKSYALLDEAAKLAEDKKRGVV